MDMNSMPKQNNVEAGKDKEPLFEKIDRKSPEILTAIAKAPIYKKTGEVRARRAVAGEALDTVLASGELETTNTANEGDWIVTNPDGEQYIISDEKFSSRYEATDREGVYATAGFCRAISNPFRKPIEIMASWGEAQRGNEEVMIADTCDAQGNPDGEPYLIEKAAFEKTYSMF